MTNGALASRAVWTRLAAACLIPGMVLACDVSTRRERERAARADAAHEAAAADAPYQAEVEEGLGAAVAILVDTSGSMKERVAGDSRRKSEVAQEALEAMLDATDAFVARRPDFPIKIGIYSFSSSVRAAAPDPALRSRRRSSGASTACRGPGGGTAIGDAMREARPDLYRAGVFRKYLLVVTDGENTNGRQPGRSGARDLPQERGRRADLLRRLRHQPGEVRVPEGGRRRRHRRRQRRRSCATALDGIYQGKILAEAAGGERNAVKK